MSNEKKVSIGPIPLDQMDKDEKYLTLSVNGKSIMLERGKRHEVSAEFAAAYEHRIQMQMRANANRAKRKEDLQDKQTHEGVSFM
jgi:hypothetical protein